MERVAGDGREGLAAKEANKHEGGPGADAGGPGAPPGADLDPGNAHPFQAAGAGAGALTTWHVDAQASPTDVARDRAILLKQLVKLLKRCRAYETAGDERTEKIDAAAQRIEDALYKESKNKEEYLDSNTLGLRVCQFIQPGWRPGASERRSKKIKTSSGNGGASRDRLLNDLIQDELAGKTLVFLPEDDLHNAVVNQFVHKRDHHAIGNFLEQHVAYVQRKLKGMKECTSNEDINAAIRGLKRKR